MIPIDQLIPTVNKKLKSLEIGQCLDIRTYKRDRRVLIEKLEDGYHVYQDGFERNLFSTISLEKLPKLMKTLIKKEFPRSNQVRIYTLSAEEFQQYKENWTNNH